MLFSDISSFTFTIVHAKHCSVSDSLQWHHVLKSVDQWLREHLQHLAQSNYTSAFLVYNTFLSSSRHAVKAC